jgi:hypothetical protein
MKKYIMENNSVDTGGCMWFFVGILIYMNRNIQLLLGGIGLLVIVIAVYLAIGRGGKSDTMMQSPTKGTEKQEVVATPENTPAAKVMMSSVILGYKCNDGKSLDINRPPTGVTITLQDGADKREMSLVLNAKKSTAGPVFENKEQGVVVSIKGQVVSVQEKGKATFSDCKLVK